MIIKTILSQKLLGFLKKKFLFKDANRVMFEGVELYLLISSSNSRNFPSEINKENIKKTNIYNSTLSNVKVHDVKVTRNINFINYEINYVHIII